MNKENILSSIEHANDLIGRVHDSIVDMAYKNKNEVQRDLLLETIEETQDKIALTNKLSEQFIRDNV